LIIIHIFIVAKIQKVSSNFKLFLYDVNPSILESSKKLKYLKTKIPFTLFLEKFDKI